MGEGDPGKVPLEGENAIVPPGVIIIFDIEESPILELLTINGCLNFLSDGSKDQHLRAHQIYVQGGQLEIGKSAVPYSRKATITLFGEESADVVVMDGATEAGNKLIANNGVLSFVGLSRSREARLFAVANKGDSTVIVTLGLDWVAGDELAFIATAMQHDHTEYTTVQSYNKVTGELVLTAPLEFYHFGAPSSTGDNYQGIDMRGEVILLTRNIVIQGDSSENDYAGQFVTADASQLSESGEETVLSGLTVLKNVEIFNMGQKNTPRGALRIQNSKKTEDDENHRIENVVIHHSKSFALYIDNVDNAMLLNIDVVGAVQIGL
jgi:hypothetical protein